MNIEIPFSSWMTDFFECRDHEKLLKEIFVHFKIPVENSQMDKSGFTLDWILHFQINFHNLALMQGSS